jgi:hypothetical protein
MQVCVRGGRNLLRSYFRFVLLRWRLQELLECCYLSFKLKDIIGGVRGGGTVL